MSGESIVGRVWVIGLDGMPVTLLRRWTETGQLPTLAQLMANGAWGSLESVIQPVSANAWSSFITGTNAGQHGIYDFSRRILGSYSVELTNASLRGGYSLWRILSDAGRRVGVVNVPMTYPPEAVNGYLVSGLVTPGLDSLHTYPPELAKEIDDQHFIAVSTVGKSHSQYLAETLEGVDRRFEVQRRLMAREPVDFFLNVIMETDAIQHCSWRMMEQPDHPGGDAILQVYQRVDRHLADLVENLPGDVTLIVMSDHGAGPIDKVVHLNRWLAQQGWLRFRSGAGLGNRVRRVAGVTLARSMALAQRYLPVRIKGLLKRSASMHAQVTSFVQSVSVEWSATRAFSLGNQGNICLNVVGREPQGIVQPGEEYESLREEIIIRLLELRDPETGEPVVERVYRREEIYSGPYLELAPDLLILWVEDRYVSKDQYEPQQGPVFDRRLKFGLGSAEYALDQTGTHTMNGIVICAGQHVRAGARIQGALLIDLPSTILYLLGVPIPAQMEGKVLLGALTEAFTQAHLVHYAGPKAGEITVPGSTLGGYVDEDEAIVRQRLQQLGYVA